MGGDRASLRAKIDAEVKSLPPLSGSTPLRFRLCPTTFGNMLERLNIQPLIVQQLASKCSWWRSHKYDSYRSCNSTKICTVQSLCFSLGAESLAPVDQ